MRRFRFSDQRPVTGDAVIWHHTQMARWTRDTLEIGAQRDAKSGKWYFVIIGADRRVMRESERTYDSEHEARAAARDWMVQTLLR